jgi:hypothetical protein
MKDYVGEEIELGDEVYVMKPIDGFINDEKVYKIEGFRPDENRVIITDDRGLEGHYESTRFVVSMAGRMFRNLQDEADTKGLPSGSA